CGCNMKLMQFHAQTDLVRQDGATAAPNNRHLALQLGQPPERSHLEFDLFRDPQRIVDLYAKIATADVSLNHADAQRRSQICHIG
ncbi:MULTISPECIES: hypothetical protein, partial [unclassified Sinorhizobium]|uniref:hypothetical protein n=1 Tax=unclassified Sinorhizobium TaxID=2613772 RepID=UPI00352653E5